MHYSQSYSSQKYKYLTKIGNGEPQEQHEFEIFQKIDIAALCPNGVHLFFKNDDVDEYNSFILNQCEDKVVSTSIDILLAPRVMNKKLILELNYIKKSVIDTGGLPYAIK